MKNKPPYAVESVDNALRILQALRDSGRLRVSEVAGELGIARSTAHRLLSMLVYRDFAIRSEDHSYLPGPALSAPPLHGEPMARLRNQLRPHMEALRDQVGETINLQVRLGAQARFLYTVESTQVLRVGDRQETILPAWSPPAARRCWPSFQTRSSRRCCAAFRAARHRDCPMPPAARWSPSCESSASVAGRRTSRNPLFVRELTATVTSVQACP